ncbi:hypothetical protein INT43_001453 [Umbelopsis isabellina]|uniref:Uncharacterized protein n=1 Tax=Mortierella isabellina TaxID=91625 RepID=A0A8H7PDN3_MORIS|nr:hypothetical protein INT43_001453 [Umbelopsis isabellina]
MKGLVLPWVLATLLLAQGALARLFSTGTYAISPNINEPNYLAATFNNANGTKQGIGKVTNSKQLYRWKVETSDGKWTIKAEEAEAYLGFNHLHGHQYSADITSTPQEWKIEQHERREGTWRIVKPQSRDHPDYGDISVLTYHGYHSPYDGNSGKTNAPKVVVQHLEYISKPSIIQFWRFTRLE